MAFQALRLTDLSADQKAIVAKVNSSDKNVIRQLRELGLQRGVSAIVLANNPGAPLLVAVGDGRIAVNRDIADLVKVVLSDK